MALHTELPIYKQAKALMVFVAELSSNLPRCHRRIADKLNDECIGIMMSIFRANVVIDKVRHLDALREHLEVTKQLLQLALELHIISEGQWAKTAEYAGSIGKQTTGWRNKELCRPLPDGQGCHD